MAVVSTTENPFDREVGQDERGATRTRVYTVITDDAEDTAIFGGVPALGADYPGTSGTLVVQRHSATHPSGANGKTWRVTVEYGAPDAEESGDENVNPNIPTVRRETDPKDDPIAESGEFEDVMEAIDKDLDDLPIQTTAEEPYDPPIEEEVSRQVLTLEKVEQNNPRTKARQYHNKVNSADFYGYAKHTLRVKISYQSFNWTKPSTGATETRYRVRYRFTHNEKKWIPREILNAGFRAKFSTVDGDGNFGTGYDEILTDTGERPSNPVKLTREGFVASPFDDPYYNEFRTKEEANFGGLGLGLG